MIKIAALNDESEDDSDSEVEVTREALEQIALQQYAKALDLQRKGSLAEAMQLLKDLLDTELLYDIRKPGPGEKTKEPLFNLKYLCYKNVASIQSSIGEKESAIESYSLAAELDDTDITLWHRLGLLCIDAHDYERALHAFQCGVNRNPRHWPCLDKIITLQLALEYYGDCISTIYNTLQLDQGYLRGLVYRQYIYTNFRHITDFLIYLDPKYKFDNKECEPIDEQKAKNLINEAEEINKIYLEQLNTENFKYNILPVLKLKKPITKLTWMSVGESLVHMHQYMSENSFSHACVIEINFEKEDKPDSMEICEEEKQTETCDVKMDDNVEIEKIIENGSDENNELSDKTATDTEKVESDIDAPPIEPSMEQAAELPSDTTHQQNNEQKEAKKAPSRRRGSALSFLEQWEWCNKRRSGRKKTNKQDRSDGNIYETLRRMIPNWLVLENTKKKENEIRENSPDTMDLYKLFEEKQNKEELDKIENLEYFDSETEQNDVNDYVNKFTQNKCDIIVLLKEFLNILAGKWQIKWPNNLWKIFVEANKCYNNHIDIPSCTENNRDELQHYTFVNILCEEFLINDKLNSTSEEKQSHELNVIENIGIALTMKPNFFGTACLELMLRHLWVKLHIHLINKCDEFALDCLYQLLHEFQAMGEHHDTYHLEVLNITFKPVINEAEITTYIKFLERNKQLSTVLELYNKGDYEEILPIVIDSFEHCKSIARKQEEEMSLDFAVQLSLILDCYWALGKVEECFKWSLTCLHEALKHYFHCTTGNAEIEKWSLATVKVLCCMEHILTTEGLSCIDTLSQKELSMVLEDLIRIIGHQVETNASEMPFGTVVPWIIIHYILQREDDHGRSKKNIDTETIACDEVPSSLMLLFLGHDQLGNHGWCCKNEGKLLHFILDTVVPRLRSPSLSRSLEQVCQYMEQCVYCLFGHPSKKNKLKYLTDHNVTPQSLDWNRAQQLYEIFRPLDLPVVEGKIPSISADTEQLFRRILTLLPVEFEPHKYVQDMEKYINCKEDKLPTIPPLLPYKMKDIYFLMGDYYFKKEERKWSVKYNIFDIIINNDRCESWAEIALAKAVNLELKLNSCINIDNDKDYLGPARAIIRCFQRALELDTLHCNLWVEYGVFVYGVYSFCSRLLKHASESLSMNDFESLEKQKDEMLNTTQKCFNTVIQYRISNSHDKDKVNDEIWLHYYMLGKVAEKRNKPPSISLDYYMKAVKSLEEADAIYPVKINYNSPQHLSIEVLELHYRVHASILKYIEQHENKPIPMSVGKVFLTSIEEWKTGPFSKKSKKEGTDVDIDTKNTDTTPHPANILKRSISDAGEEDNQEAKKLKLESVAAKVRRSASYDTERTIPKEMSTTINQQVNEISKTQNNKGINNTFEDNVQNLINKDKKINSTENELHESTVDAKTNEINETNRKQNPEKKQETVIAKKEDTSSSTSSTNSSSDSSSDDSSSDSTSDSSKDSDTSSKSSNDNRPLTDEETMNIISACLDALEDCSSRFSQHYKAIYRLAHYHFYYKKGKDIEKCRDLMLTNFTSRSNQKLGGLFCERKQTNFFNGVWRIPVGEVDRPGGFSAHMNRCVLLSMEILKEIDDQKTLLELSMHLQRVPEPDKKYLRDADREDLAQQAFSLCVQSLKGQLLKFSQQADLKSNDVEKHALNSLILDIYRAYLKVQKQPNSKQLSNLLIEGYKLICNTPVNENTNLVDISMKYCQSLIAALKQKATLASLDKNNHNIQKKQAKTVENIKSTPTTSQPKSDQSKSVPAPSGMSTQDLTAAFQSYLPMLNEPLLSQQTAAALSLSYLSNLRALAGYSLQNTIQSLGTRDLESSLQNSFQSEFYRQFLSPNYSAFGLPPPKKQKKTKASSTTGKAHIPISSISAQMKGLSKSSGVSMPHTSIAKTTQSSVITSVPRSISTSTTKSLGPAVSINSSSLPNSFGSQAQPAHITSSSQSRSSTSLVQAHMANSSTVNAAIHTKPPLPHQQVSPGKTLQEKLAERQKHHPTIKSSLDINASINRLPSSLTITKTVQKQIKKPEIKKSLSYNESEVSRPKPTMSSNEVIILDDDD